MSSERAEFEVLGIDYCVVSEALVRYVNSGVTLGAVNLPEVNLRSLTLDEPNHARVSQLHPKYSFHLHD